MGDATFEYQLGEHEGRVYFLVARARPDLDDPEEFGVTVRYNDPVTGESIQIARIDTAHGYTHFDRLYRRDEPKEELDLDFWEQIVTGERFTPITDRFGRLRRLRAHGEETRFVCDDFQRVQNPRLMTDDYFENVVEIYDELAEKEPQP